MNNFKLNYNRKDKKQKIMSKLFEIIPVEKRGIEKTARFIKASGVRQTPVVLTTYKTGSQEYDVCMEYDTENTVFRFFVKARPYNDKFITAIEHIFIETEDANETESVYKNLTSQLEHHILETAPESNE